MNPDVEKHGSVIVLQPVSIFIDVFYFCAITTKTMKNPPPIRKLHALWLYGRIIINLAFLRSPSASRYTCTRGCKRISSCARRTTTTRSRRSTASPCRSSGLISWVYYMRHITYTWCMYLRFSSYFCATAPRKPSRWVFIRFMKPSSFWTCLMIRLVRKDRCLF